MSALRAPEGFANRYSPPRSPMLLHMASVTASVRKAGVPPRPFVAHRHARLHNSATHAHWAQSIATNSVPAAS
eukprot:8976975-Lingulodinium_polyedra.AAC.1